MWDTIHCRLPRHHLPNPKEMDRIISNLENSNLNIDCESGEENYFVKMRNLTFKTTTNYINIKCSSISKFLFGNGLMTLSREDIMNFVNYISTTFHIPFELAEITRMDFGMNIVTDHSPEIYCNYFGYSYPYRNRLEQTNGLYYKMTNKEICIYDKLKRMKNRGYPIHYKGKYVWRFELRFIGRVSKQLNLGKVLVKDLYNETFLHSMIEVLKNEYLGLTKYSEESDGIYPTSKIPSLTDQLTKRAIEHYGIHHLIKKINEWYALRLIKKDQASRLRKRVKYIMTMDFGGNSNNLIQELDRKVVWMAIQMHYLV